MRTPYATARRLYLKLWMWWNDICPEHGTMDGGRFSNYCLTCARKANAKRAAKIDRIMEEYGKA